MRSLYGVTWPLLGIALMISMFIPAFFPSRCSAADTLPPAGGEALPKDNTAKGTDALPKDNEVKAVDKVSPIMMAVEERHESIERSILDRVIRFDNFFGSLKTENLKQPDYRIRWVNSLRFEESKNPKYRTNIRAGFVFPRIAKRLRIVIAGETEAEPVSARLPEDPGSPGFDRTLSDTRLVNTELRYALYRTTTTDFFLGAGVRVRLPFEYFTRLRFHHLHKLGDRSLIRFGETLFWKNTEEFGETTEIDIERQLNPKTLLRWSNAGTLSEQRRGLEWGSDVSLIRELTPKSAITFSGGVFGATEAPTAIETYRVLARFRQNFLRPWLFHELEPEVSWPRQPDGRYSTTFAFTARLEIVFQGKDVKPPDRPIH